MSCLAELPLHGRHLLARPRSRDTPGTQSQSSDPLCQLQHLSILGSIIPYNSYNHQPARVLNTAHLLRQPFAHWQLCIILLHSAILDKLNWRRARLVLLGTGRHSMAKSIPFLSPGPTSANSSSRSARVSRRYARCSATSPEQLDVGFFCCLCGSQFWGHIQ